jgi:homoserine kinase
VSHRVRVIVPATTSNLGPGFDLFGLALDRYLRLTIRIDGTFMMRTGVDTEWTTTWSGQGSGAPAPVPEGSRNLVVRGIERAWEEAGVQCRGRVIVEASSEIPVARGLGSSAAALIGGLLAGEALADIPLGPERLIAIAASEEGHPDNAAAALLGGLVASAQLQPGARVLCHRARLHEDFLLVAVVPAFTLSTRLAREALPGHLPFRDAVRSQQRTFFLFQALTEGRGDLLRELVEDVLHQPHRAPLIPAFDDLLAVAYRAGAIAAWLSGAGPTLMLLTSSDADQAERSGEAVRARWLQEGIESEVVLLSPDDVGAAVQPD